MNERIRELYDQCFVELENDTPNVGFDFEKFAELIVRECGEVLSTETIRHDGYGYNQHVLYQKIRKHFGIEQ